MFFLCLLKCIGYWNVDSEDIVIGNYWWVVECGVCLCNKLNRYVLGLCINFVYMGFVFGKK